MATEPIAARRAVLTIGGVPSGWSCTTSRMARQYRATLQFRTTLDQSGRVAGLAGELDVSEAVVLRELVDLALEDPKILRVLERRQEERRAAIEEAIEDGDESRLAELGVTRRTRHA